MTMEYDNRSWTQRLIYNVEPMFILSGSSGAAYGTEIGLTTPGSNSLLKIQASTVLNQMDNQITEYYITHCLAENI